MVTVLTGKDFGEELGVCINAWPITPDQKTPAHSPMPADRVAFAGEIVAVVVARSAAEARDAAETVDSSTTAEDSAASRAAAALRATTTATISPAKATRSAGIGEWAGVFWSGVMGQALMQTPAPRRSPCRSAR